MKATLYCVAARKDNAIPFPFFLFLSCNEQPAALASEMQPQLIPSLWAWVMAIGNVWWELTSLEIPQGWRECWEGCAVNVNTQSLIMWHWLHVQGSLFLLLERVLHVRVLRICSSPAIFRALLLQKEVYMCNKSIVRKNIHSVTNIFMTIPYRGTFCWPCSSCSFPKCPQYFFCCYPRCLQTCHDALKHITSCPCSGHSPLLLPKKKKKASEL